MQAHPFRTYAKVGVGGMTAKVQAPELPGVDAGLHIVTAAIHGIGKFGTFNILAHGFYFALAVLAALDWFRAYSLPVGTWAIMVTVLAGCFLAGWFMSYGPRKVADADATSGSVLNQHYDAFVMHLVVKLLSVFLLAAYVWIFYTQHTKANLAAFNDRRNTNGSVLTGLEDMHLQWAGFLWFVVGLWFVNLTTLGLLIMRMLDPLVTAPVEYVRDVLNTI